MERTIYSALSQNLHSILFKHNSSIKSSKPLHIVILQNTRNFVDGLSYNLFLFAFSKRKYI